ncbi:MAG: hypothetical protein ACD_76C00058G0004 [uncultured bacterium]|nr:MAG: hypothetical protein ACD_76C00058G0004 [uncultured bacterium]HBD05665.1 hypothetical protein [Candidatus Uhrbacteria bacterium]
MTNFIKKLFSLDSHRHPIDMLAEINSIISGFALYPQLIKIIMGSSILGLSFISFLIISMNSVIWVVYGYHRKSKPLLISSTLNFISSSGVLLFILLK